MKRIKTIQMQMRPARMHKVFCFSSSVFILLKTDLGSSELGALVCVHFQPQKSLVLARALLSIWDIAAVPCDGTRWNTAGLWIPLEPYVVAPKGWSVLQNLPYLMRLSQSSQNCGIAPYSS